MQFCYCKLLRSPLFEFLHSTISSSLAAASFSSSREHGGGGGGDFKIFQDFAILAEVALRRHFANSNHTLNYEHPDAARGQNGDTHDASMEKGEEEEVQIVEEAMQLGPVRTIKLAQPMA